jgi:hypothetical protein
MSKRYIFFEFFRSTLRRVLAAQQRAPVNTTDLASATAKLLTELAKPRVPKHRELRSESGRCRLIRNSGYR